jgi:hypothetical protein
MGIRRKKKKALKAETRLWNAQADQVEKTTAAAAVPGKWDSVVAAIAAGEASWDDLSTMQKLSMPISYQMRCRAAQRRRSGTLGDVQGVEDLAAMADLVTEFVGREHLTVVPAIPTTDYGPQVRLRPGELDIQGFLDLAVTAGGGVLYLESETFNPFSPEDQPDGMPAYLLRHEGEIGQISVAFAANGVMHFWKYEAAWYLEWEELTAVAIRGDHLSDEERDRLVGELADAILVDPQFRAERLNRRWIARRTCPPDTDSGVFWRAISEASDRAELMAQEWYDKIEGQLDALAAELLADPAWQQARSAAARKQAAVRFLIPRADGFSPPTLMRDELYARARDLAKVDKTAGLAGNVGALT